MDIFYLRSLDNSPTQWCAVTFSFHSDFGLCSRVIVLGPSTDRGFNRTKDTAKSVKDTEG